MRDGRRRVCFVLPSLNGGGAERAAVQVLNGLDSSRWQRSMFLFARQGPYLSDVDPNIEVASADSPSRLGQWQALRRFVAAERPDLVVAFLSYFSVLTAARAANVGAKVIFNLQTPMSAFLTDADYHWRRKWHRATFKAVTRIGYSAVDLVVTTSRGVAQDLTANFGVDPDRIRVLPNPVDLDAVRAAAADGLDATIQARWQSPVIVAAGRLADAKNYPLLIEALAVLRQRIPARLFILGQGDLELQLRSLVTARGLDGAVVFLGFQQNPWKFIARADVFALTSHYEGFGNVLIEAMACGVPVVATASAGTRDIVAHGRDGRLVDPHTAAGVAEALAQILADEPTRIRMATAARAAASRFSVPLTVGAYEGMFGEVSQ